MPRTKGPKTAFLKGLWENPVYYRNAGKENATEDMAEEEYIEAVMYKRDKIPYY